MAKRYIFGLMIAIFVLAFAGSVMAVGNGSPAPAFNLKDQFGKEWNLTNLKGSVVVVITANPDSGKLMDPWMSNLKTQYGSKIQLIGLMDLRSVPWIGRGIAKSRIKKETSDPLMLDFSGNTAKLYSVSSKYPVVTVIDKGGVVRAQMTTYNKDAYASVTGAIDKALK